MRFRNAHRLAGQRGELKMTAMIDVVFLLLIFFVMTFQIVSPEGDFRVAMPRQAGPDYGPDLPPVLVRLTADADGQLSDITLGRRPIESFEQLGAEIRGLIGDRPGSAAGVEVELICDEHLNFEHAIDAVTAVSGYLDDGQIVKLIEKIRFQPIRRRTNDG